VENKKNIFKEISASSWLFDRNVLKYYAKLDENKNNVLLK
jgi:hypothetical protein